MVCILLSSASITTLHPEQSSTCGGLTSLNPAALWKQKATCVNYDTTYLSEYENFFTAHHLKNRG